MSLMEKIKSITLKLDTPYYIYSEENVNNTINNLKNCFSEDYYEILYALKANANPHLLKIITMSGLGVDACSIEEVLLALKCSVPKDKIFYNSDCLTEKELSIALQQKVRVTVGSLDAIHYLAKHHPAVTISLRLNSGGGAGHSDSVITNGDLSKFGISILEIDEALSLCNKAGILIEGIHSHTGSGEMDPNKFIENAEVMFELSKKFQHLVFINFGGGFGYDYVGGVDYNISRVHYALNSMRDKLNINNDIRFIIEPGRYIVAAAGVLVSQVCSVKEVNAIKYIGLNTGYNHFPRCFYYNAWHEIENISKPDAEKVLYDITGYLCQSGDVFARQRYLTKSKVGDFICIKDVGAYGYAMSSNFNLRTRPAEYLLMENDSIKMIRRAETFEDVLSTCNMDE